MAARAARPARRQRRLRPGSAPHRRRARAPSRAAPAGPAAAAAACPAPRPPAPRARARPGCPFRPWRAGGYASGCAGMGLCLCASRRPWRAPGPQVTALPGSVSACRSYLPGHLQHLTSRRGRIRRLRASPALASATRSGASRLPFWQPWRTPRDFACALSQGTAWTL